MKTAAVLVLLFAPALAAADGAATAVARNGAEAAPANDASALSASPAPAENTLSPRVATMLAAAVAKAAPPPRPPEKSAASGPRVEPAPMDVETAAHIVRLPRYVVREPKLPTPTEVMTQRELARVAMNRYLGPSDGLDRGLLNSHTIAEYWRKIPVLGWLLPPPFGSITNEERALMRYYEDERLRQMNGLLDLARMTSKAGDPALGKRIEQETKTTFMRKDDE